MGLKNAEFYFSFPGKTHERKREVLRGILLGKERFRKLPPKKSENIIINNSG